MCLEYATTAKRQTRKKKKKKGQIILNKEMSIMFNMN